MWAQIPLSFRDPESPFPVSRTTRLLKDEGCLINSTANYLRYVLLQTDKEVIRMDMPGLQGGKMFHCQDNAIFPAPPPW